MRILLALFVFAFLPNGLVAQVERGEENVEYVPVSQPERDTTNRNPELHQTAKSSNFWNRIRYGGNIRLSFGSATFVELSPRVGYQFSEDFIAGLGISTTYLKYDDPYSNYLKDEFFIYGGSLFGTYILPKNIPIAFHAEFEMLNFDVYNSSIGEAERIWTPAGYVGIGYFSRFSSGGGTYFFILYDFLHDPNRSLYNTPYAIRFGFLF